METGQSSYAFAHSCKSEGVNTAPEEEPALPDMVCPLLPQKSGNNFWKSSCLIKQQMVEHRATCYPSCKNGKGMAKYHELTEESKDKMLIKAQERTKRLEKELDIMITLYKKGKSAADIAEALQCKKGKVITRLSSYGFKYQRPPSKKDLLKKVFESNKDITFTEAAKMFGLTHKTARSYLNDFKFKEKQGR